MVGNMKTTVDIADGLLAEAKRVAARKHTTVRALVEDGLRLVLEREHEQPPFRLRDASVGGGWMREEFATVGWDEIRDIAYEGRGA
jgi:hypothetical protein